jgi:uncharacterized protein YidB (DUF937 family)
VNILEVLTAGQGGQVVGNLAQSFGLDRAQSAAVLGAVVPELTHALERQSFNRGGIADMVAALGRADYAKVLAPGAALATPDVQAVGVEALDTMLWSKDRSRNLAHRAARQSGVDEALIRQMLPAIGALVMGGLASKAGGALDGVAQQFGDTGGPSASPGGGVGNQQRLPIPGERPRLERGSNPYGDLSDVIRRGGTKLPRGQTPSAPRSPSGGGIELPQGGGSLETVIRDLLGSVLGFQNKSVIGWILRIIIVRWGWGFIQSILRRLLLGR